MAHALPVVRDAVLLVPGFLGIGRIGRFYYFSERISAAIRAGVEARTGRPALVVPCYTKPIGSLADRQAFLLDQLGIVDKALPALERIHLVGHSAGGVDAQLLACERPLAAELDSWAPFPARAKIASVVGIAAAYHGTFLAQAEAVRLLAGQLRAADGAGSLARMVLDLSRLILHQPALPDVLQGARNQFPEAVAFLLQLVRHRDLMRDLDPDAMLELRQKAKPDKRIPLTSFVTLAGLRTNERRAPDGFFRDLWELTGRHARAAHGTVPAAIRRLSAATSEKIDERSSDGVVNSALQLLDPSNAAELGGVILADHADVIGHYDRGKGVLEERSQQIGLFHSGSGFDDDQFFALYSQVVDAICRAIPDASLERLSA